MPCLKYSVPIFVELRYKMQRLEVSGAVRPLYGSLGVEGLRRIRVYVMNVHWSSCRVPVILVGVYWKLNFFRQVSEEIPPNIKFVKNPSSGSQLVPRGQVVGRTDMTKLCVHVWRRCRLVPYTWVPTFRTNTLYLPSGLVTTSQNTWLEETTGWIFMLYWSLSDRASSW